MVLAVEGFIPVAQYSGYPPVAPSSCSRQAVIRPRGPRGSALFAFAEGSLPHLQSQAAAGASAAGTIDEDHPRSKSAGQSDASPTSRLHPETAVRGDDEASTASGSDANEIPSDDTDFSSDEQVLTGEFASRREFLCFTYLSGCVRVTPSQYDIMREAGNYYDLEKKWSSRWRLQKLRNHMLKFAIPFRREKTTHQLPVGKEKALIKLSDATVSYIPFSELIKRDFGDPATAVLFHSKGDARMETVERPAEFSQTVAARDSARFNFKNAFVFKLWYQRRRFNYLCIETDRSQAIKRVLSPPRRGRKTFS